LTTFVKERQKENGIIKMTLRARKIYSEFLGFQNIEKHWTWLLNKTSNKHIFIVHVVR
jgi:hypothetical protein